MGTRRLAIEIDVDYSGGGEVRAAVRDIKELGNAGDKAGPGLQKTEKASEGLTSKLKGLVGPDLIALAGKQILEFGKASLMAASDVEEMQSKFNTVFKSLSSDVTAELQEFADAANRSIYDLQGFAATLQDTFVPLGFARDSAADMSIQLVKLAEDLGSFNNLPTQQVVEDLQSALVGNTETLRKYGVVATQAAIDEKALAMGLEFTKGKMDAQTKAAAILAITMDSTTDAQGDAIKTADSLANQFKGLEAATSRLSVAIGQGLVPSAQEGVGVVTALTNVVADFATAENALNQAVESGLITEKERVSMWNEMVFTGTTATDILDRLAEAEANLGVEVSIADTRLESQEMSMQRAIMATESLTAITDEEREAMIAAGEAAQGNFDELEGLTRAQIEATVQRDIAVQAAEAQAEADTLAAEAAAEHAERQRELAAATGDYFVKAIEAEDATIDTNQALFDAADASGASAEQLAILGGALGLYSEEAVEAALQTALIQAKINELAEAYVNGEMSVTEMKTSLNSFIQGLNSTGDSMNDATGDAAALREEILSIPTEHTTVFTSDLSGFQLPPTAAAEAATATTAGGGMGGVTMDTGGIVPGAFMAPVPATVHGGEMILNPSQQAELFALLNGRGGGMGGGAVIQIINQGVKGDNVAANTQRGVLDAMRQVGQY